MHHTQIIKSFFASSLFIRQVRCFTNYGNPEAKPDRRVIIKSCVVLNNSIVPENNSIWCPRNPTLNADRVGNVIV